VISGVTNLTKANFNEGTLILGADNPISGTTTISGGTLQLGNGAASRLRARPHRRQQRPHRQSQRLVHDERARSGSGTLTVAGTFGSNVTLANSNTLTPSARS